MYLLHDAATLAPVLIRMIQAMDSFLSGFESDGACTEGLGYWNYGFGFFVTFAERLFARTGGRVDLMNDDKIRQISLFQQRVWLGGDCVLSFSDGGRFGRWHPGLTDWLRRRLPEVKAPDVRYIHRFGDDPCHRWNWDLRNFIWADPQESGSGTDPAIQAAVAAPVKRDLFAVKSVDTRRSGRSDLLGNGEKAGEDAKQESTDMLAGAAVPDNTNSEPTGDPDSIWFPDAAWLVSKTAWEGGTAVFAAKGGHNDEPHNHNDLGSFLLHAEGETFLDDAGSGEYTKGYFGPERYGFLVNGSFGHSVPFFGQVGQSAGKCFKADVILAETGVGTGADVLALDLTRAYDLPALRSFTRTFQWEKGAAPCLILEDHVVMEDAGLSVKEGAGPSVKEGAGPSVKEDTGLSGKECTGLPVTERAGLPVTERFVSFLKPIQDDSGILLRGKSATVRISTETPGFIPSISEETFSNHEGEPEILWKVDFTHPAPEQEIRFRAEFWFHKG